MIAVILFNFCFGFLMGVVYKWSKKVLFGIIIAGIIGILIATLMVGNEIEKSFNTFQFIIEVVSSAIGMWSGINFYEGIFEIDKL